MTRRLRDLGSSVAEHALLVAFIAAIVLASGTLVARTVAQAAEAPLGGVSVPAPAPSASP